MGKNSVAVAKRVGGDLQLSSGDILNIQSPPHLVIDNRQLATLITGTMVEQDHRGVEFIGRRGSPQTVAIGNSGATVNVAQPGEAKQHGGFWRGFMRAMAEAKPLPAPGQAPQMAAQAAQAPAQAPTAAPQAQHKPKRKKSAPERIAQSGEKPMCSCCNQPKRGLSYVN